METRVLIPKELNLTIVESNKAEENLNNNNLQHKQRPSSLVATRFLEPSICVIAGPSGVKAGTKFSLFQGSIRCGRLDVYSTLPESDVRVFYGGLDEIQDLGAYGQNRKVRLCNWIRFLTRSRTEENKHGSDFNVKCHVSPTQMGQVVFEAVKDIPANGELIAEFPSPADLLEEQKTTTSESSTEAERHQSLIKLQHQYLANKLALRALSVIVAESALDLSLPLLTKSSTSSPSSSPLLLPPLMTSANSAFSPTSLRSSPALAFPNPQQASSPSDSGVSSISPSYFNPVIVPSSNKSHPPTPPLSPAVIKPEAVIDDEDEEDEIEVDDVDEEVNSETKSPISTPAASPVKEAKAKSTTTRRGKKMLPCGYCGKAFDRPSLLNRHLRTHTGERPHVCEICQKGFSTSSSLNTHRRIHSGEKPHECGVCGKRFTASSNLYYHRMTHIKEKPHKCELCQKSFPTPGDLKSHMYIHNGSWPHRCHICDRGFSKVTNLKNHLFLHTGQKPHECHHCGKRFALGCNMKAHIKTHETSNGSATTGSTPDSHTGVAMETPV